MYMMPDSSILLCVVYTEIYVSLFQIVTVAVVAFIFFFMEYTMYISRQQQSLQYQPHNYTYIHILQVSSKENKPKITNIDNGCGVCVCMFRRTLHLPKGFPHKFVSKFYGFIILTKQMSLNFSRVCSLYVICVFFPLLFIIVGIGFFFFFWLPVHRVFSTWENIMTYLIISLTLVV